MGMAFAGLALFAFTACIDLTGPGSEGASGNGIPQGMGLARIHLGGGARTIVSDIEGYYFTLAFSAGGKTDEERTLTGSQSLTVALEPAVWNLEVKGYTDATKTSLRVTGRISVPVVEGTESDFTVYLAADFRSGGTGGLNYNISFPASTRGWLGLYPLDVPGITDEILEERDISSGAGGTASGTFTDLPEGSYLAMVDLYDVANNKAAVWTRVVHIDDGPAVSLSPVFTAAQFAACPEIVGAGETTLGAKLNAALNSPSGSYTIVLDGTETDLNSGCSLTVTGYKDITITIRGNGNELGEVGLVADFGSKISLVLHDLTIGRAGVGENGRGTLEMKAGAVITGGVAVRSGTFIMSGGAIRGGSNGVEIQDGTFIMSGGTVRGTSGSGGGVFVLGGTGGYQTTFIMSGGAVSGNSGGGVAVRNGTFTMSGGAVSGNSAGVGGGVYVDSQATFTMSGGAVSGNSATAYSVPSGGGVYVADKATFTMSGGVVSGNSTYNSSFGGGVFVEGGGTFTMSDGVVSGNSAYPSSSFTSFGGGVCVQSGSTFSMSGGEISGNFSELGGGVCVLGTFSMSGGAVSGNSARNGGGVYVNYRSAFTMSDGAISGNSAEYGGGVYVDSQATFSMNGGAVSGNSTSYNGSYNGSFGGGVYVGGGTFTMNGGAVSGNSTSSSTTAASYGGGGGVYVYRGTFSMSGGEVSGNLLSGANAYGKEVMKYQGVFTMSGDARPERIFLWFYNYYSTITIGGPLSGGIVPIDLGISTSNNSLASWAGGQILQLDSSYSSGDLASLTAHFTLGNSKMTSSPYTEAAIPANYRIGTDGKITN
jgi:hypothetical protein